MAKIKILLASRPKMISDVFRNIIEREPDMMLTGDVIDPIKLLLAVRLAPVDAVIVTPLKSNGEPKICSHLLKEHPQLKVVTVSAEGEAACLYQSGEPMQRLEKPCSQSILGAIREALK